MRYVLKKSTLDQEAANLPPEIKQKLGFSGGRKSLKEEYENDKVQKGQKPNTIVPASGFLDWSKEPLSKAADGAPLTNGASYEEIAARPADLNKKIFSYKHRNEYPEALKKSGHSWSDEEIKKMEEDEKRLQKKEFINW